MALTLTAPAKLNLSLHILGKRSDGYHEVTTRMQKVDLCDAVSLSLQKNGGITLSCDEAGLPCDETNLAVRAAKAYFEKLGSKKQPGLAILLEKRIPMSAGLGGGSSDAGAVLRGLNTLLDQPFSTEDLVELASMLGADVPFFVSDCSAVWATGIGDKLTPCADVDDFSYLLVNPGISVSTKWVFDNYALTSVTKNSKLRGSQYLEGDRFSLDSLYNDLEQVTLKHYQVVGEIRQALFEAGADGVLMTGSGPTVFGMFSKSSHDIQSLAVQRDRLKEIYGDQVFLTDSYTGA